MDGDSLALLGKAAGLGLVLAVPLGPIGLLCLRRSLSHGVAAGVAIGMGAATADAIYAGIAVFALGAAAPFIAGAMWLPAAGGVVLIAIGVRDILHGQTPVAAPTVRGHAGAFAGTVLLTLANPATILTFSAVIVGLGLMPEIASVFERLLFIGGVFLGSASWWIVLSAAAARLGERLSPPAIRWTRRCAGAAFIGFGIYALVV